MRQRRAWRGSGSVGGERPGGSGNRWRALGVGALGAMLVAALVVTTPALGRGGTASSGEATAPTAVARENRLPGTTSWRTAAAPGALVDAYTSQISAAPGETVDLHVSTAPGVRYRVDVYRLGWYGGTGGRRIQCAPSCAGSKPGSPQPTTAPDPATGEIRLAWPVTDRIVVGRDWVSGYYQLDVVITEGEGAGTARHVPLVVRAPAGRRTAIVAVAAVNTWEAYNDWGGRSLYGPADAPHTWVSFDRPFSETTQGMRDWELPAVRFLERQGYDLSYVTDVDLDREPALAERHRLVLVLGHDEYWTKTVRDALERGRDAGTNLAFLGANTGYWQIRYANDRRSIVEYRKPRLDPEPDAALKTTTFRELTPPRPECALLGVQWGQIGDTRDLAVNPSALGDPWFAGTGFAAGDTVRGVVGYEWDGVQPGCAVPPLTVLFHRDETGGQPPLEGRRWDVDSTRYTAPSGARVFAAGTLQFSWALDPQGEHPDVRLMRFMQNALDDLTRPAPPARASARVARGRSVVVAAPAPIDRRVRGAVVLRHRGPRPFAEGDRGVVVLPVRCTRVVDAPGAGTFRYAVAYLDGWARSRPVLTPAVRVASGRPGPPRCASR